jgi:hypothetical protein
MLIILSDIKWIVDKEFVLGGQSVNLAYYCEILLRLRESHPEPWRQKNWLFHHGNTVSRFLFHQEIFTRNNMTVVPIPSTLLFFSD